MAGWRRSLVAGCLTWFTSDRTFLVTGHFSHHTTTSRLNCDRTISIFYSAFLSLSLTDDSGTTGQVCTLCPGLAYCLQRRTVASFDSNRPFKRLLDSFLTIKSRAAARVKVPPS